MSEAQAERLDVGGNADARTGQQRAHTGSVAGVSSSGKAASTDAQATAPPPPPLQAPIGPPRPRVSAAPQSAALKAPFASSALLSDGDSVPQAPLEWPQAPPLLARGLGSFGPLTDVLGSGAPVSARLHRSGTLPLEEHASVGDDVVAMALLSNDALLAGGGDAVARFASPLNAAVAPRNAVSCPEELQGVAVCTSNLDSNGDAGARHAATCAGQGGGAPPPTQAASIAAPANAHHWPHQTSTQDAAVISDDDTVEMRPGRGSARSVVGTLRAARAASGDADAEAEAPVAAATAGGGGPPPSARTRSPFPSARSHAAREAHADAGAPADARAAPARADVQSPSESDPCGPNRTLRTSSPTATGPKAPPPPAACPAPSEPSAGRSPTRPDAPGRQASPQPQRPEPQPATCTAPLQASPARRPVAGESKSERCGDNDDEGATAHATAARPLQEAMNLGSGALHAAPMGRVAPASAVAHEEGASFGTRKSTPAQSSVHDMPYPRGDPQETEVHGERPGSWMQMKQASPQAAQPASIHTGSVSSAADMAEKPPSPGPPSPAHAFGGSHTPRTVRLSPPPASARHDPGAADVLVTPPDPMQRADDDADARSHPPSSAAPAPAVASHALREPAYVSPASVDGTSRGDAALTRDDSRSHAADENPGSCIGRAEEGVGPRRDSADVSSMQVPPGGGQKATMDSAPAPSGAGEMGPPARIWGPRPLHPLSADAGAGPLRGMASAFHSQPCSRGFSTATAAGRLHNPLVPRPVMRSRPSATPPPEKRARLDLLQTHSGPGGRLSPLSGSTPRAHKPPAHNNTHHAGEHAHERAVTHHPPGRAGLKRALSGSALNEMATSQAASDRFFHPSKPLTPAQWSLVVSNLKAYMETFGIDPADLNSVLLRLQGDSVAVPQFAPQAAAPSQ